MVSEFRSLSKAEIGRLREQGCSCADWSSIKVAAGFNAERVNSTHFSGEVQIGLLDKAVAFYGGVERPAGISRARIHNCRIGSNVYINNINNYIANYVIEDGAVIDNVDLLAVEGQSSFGNGTAISVLNEAGGREVTIYDHLTAQIAYILAVYRHRPKVIERLENMISQYVASVTSAQGVVGIGAVITNSGSLKNVRIGAGAVIEGAGRLENGSINSCPEAPVCIGSGVIAEDFIVCSGAKITDGVIISECFVGQATVLGRQFSAENSAFFANCEGFHGEACSLLAGPYSVSHHKSSILIAILCSFYNAGSGSNQSNHMYKLGPVHQGILERGSKTGSFSYLFWPNKIGAFSAVIGKHYTRIDSSEFPFSYIIESEGRSVLVPGINVATVGTVRDGAKWPKRDKRKAPQKNDLINFKVFSPFTVQKMITGRGLLSDLAGQCDEKTEYVTYGQLHLKQSSLQKAMDYYQTAIDKYLGDCLIERLENKQVQSLEQLRAALVSDTRTGQGKWVDVFGLLSPEEMLEEVLTAVEAGDISSIEQLAGKLEEVDNNYPDYEWAWAVKNLEGILGKGVELVSADDITALIERWKESAVRLDNLILKDARKEFDDYSMIGYGADGDSAAKEADFRAVRGTYDDNSFVCAIKADIAEKTRAADELIAKAAKWR